MWALLDWTEETQAGVADGPPCLCTLFFLAWTERAGPCLATVFHSKMAASWKQYRMSNDEGCMCIWKYLFVGQLFICITIWLAIGTTPQHQDLVTEITIICIWGLFYVKGAVLISSNGLYSLQRARLDCIGSLSSSPPSFSNVLFITLVFLTQWSQFRTGWKPSTLTGVPKMQFYQHEFCHLVIWWTYLSVRPQSYWGVLNWHHPHHGTRKCL